MLIHSLRRKLVKDEAGNLSLESDIGLDSQISNFVCNMYKVHKLRIWKRNRIKCIFQCFLRKEKVGTERERETSM